MDIVIHIVHWDDKTEPNRELRIYDSMGNAIGYGKQKIADTSYQQPLTDQQDLFATDDSKSREITYIATLNIRRLVELLDVK